MNHNRKRREAERRRRDAERSRSGESAGALPVDPAAIRPYGGWFPPDFVARGFYVDAPFTCASCGSEEVWTAAQQKWWYEVARGSPYSTARLCRGCRRDARERKGKAAPMADPWRWPGLIRKALDPALSAAGWARVHGVDVRDRIFLAYIRGEALLMFRFASGLSLDLDEGRAARTLVHVACRVEYATPGVREASLQRFLEESARALGLS